MSKAKTIVGKTLSHVLLILLSITMLFPFLWMVSTSLKSGTSIFAYPPKLIPDPVNFQNYADVFIKQPMLNGLFNSLKIAVLNTVGVLFFASMAAYSFAKLKFRGKKILFGALLATMMIPSQVTLIPMYIWFKNLGWIDTYLPLTVPAILCNAYGVFMLRQFFMTLPDSYMESAKLDGCSQPVIFFKIMLPLCTPAMATLALFTFMGNWNNFLTPLIYLNTSTKFTLPLIIMSFQNMYYSDWSLLMAASCISVLPVIILYLCTGRYFMQGIVMTGLKG